jgi:hypothetical protein
MSMRLPVKQQITRNAPAPSSSKPWVPLHPLGVGSRLADRLEAAYQKLPYYRLCIQKNVLAGTPLHRPVEVKADQRAPSAAMQTSSLG